MRSTFLLPLSLAALVLSLLAKEHQSLENLVNILANSLGKMPCREVTLVNLIGNQLIGNLSPVKKPRRISFRYLFHDELQL